MKKKKNTKKEEETADDKPLEQRTIDAKRQKASRQNEERRKNYGKDEMTYRFTEYFLLRAFVAPPNVTYARRRGSGGANSANVRAGVCLCVLASMCWGRGTSLGWLAHFIFGQPQT